MNNLFSQRLTDLLLENNISKRAFATNIGVSAQSISDWTTGKVQPTADMIIKVARYFSCTTDFLLGVEDEYGNVNVQNDRSLSPDEEFLLVTFRKISKQRRLNLLEVATGLSILDDHGV